LTGNFGFDNILVDYDKKRKYFERSKKLCFFFRLASLCGAWQRKRLMLCQSVTCCFNNGRSRRESLPRKRFLIGRKELASTLKTEPRKSGAKAEKRFIFFA